MPRMEPLVKCKMSGLTTLPSYTLRVIVNSLPAPRHNPIRTTMKKTALIIFAFILASDFFCLSASSSSIFALLLNVMCIIQLKQLVALYYLWIRHFNFLPNDVATRHRPGEHSMANSYLFICSAQSITCVYHHGECAHFDSFAEENWNKCEWREIVRKVRKRQLNVIAFQFHIWNERNGLCLPVHKWK